ncbi:MAG: GAF domain-containing protein [Proteobacteria bacterium]|nr:MAG: GAF domain-containing protein [Pseudomonadota bacterium]
MKIRYPENEEARLSMLRSLKVLDTEAETLFDDLVLLAAQISRSPISVLSLVDGDRQWFKAKRGLDAAETSREISFCTHTILNARGEAFIVRDASEDSKFSDNPLVTGELQIRFYAGFPLVLFGEYAVGSLCVIDREAKDLSDEQLTVLSKLADIAIKRLEALAPDLRSNALLRYLPQK